MLPPRCGAAPHAAGSGTALQTGTPLGSVLHQSSAAPAAEQEGKRSQRTYAREHLSEQTMPSTSCSPPGMCSNTARCPRVGLVIMLQSVKADSSRSGCAGQQGSASSLTAKIGLVCHSVGWYMCYGIAYCPISELSASTL